MQRDILAIILRRAGTALLVVGVLDICAMIFSIINGISYSSSFNIFAVVGGIFLIRGSLRAAAIIRWLSIFGAAALLSVALVSPVLQPLGLSFTEFKLDPLGAVFSLALFAGATVFLFWLARQLSLALVLAARVAASRKLQTSKLPVGLGVGLALVLAVTSVWVQRTDAATRAVHEAELTYGTAYRYHVSALNYSKNNEGTLVSGVVKAWSESAVQSIPFKWRE